MTNATSSERLLGKARQHWAVFISPAVPLIFSITTFIMGIKSDQGIALICMSGLFFIVGILELTRVSVRYFTTDLSLTTRRIVAHTGLLRRIQIEILLNQVESITVTQPLLGQLFDYGSVVIVGAGGTHQSIPSLTKPEIIRRAIYNQLQANRAE